MNKITTRDFIENIKFSYFKTYSFQRIKDFEIYENLFIKRGMDRDALSPEEKTLFEKLHTLTLEMENGENNFIFKKNGELNETAELICNSNNFIGLNDKLIEILKMPFFNCYSWMCWPKYRDAILFFDADDNLVDGINICFECSDVINLAQKDISTDTEIYEKLKYFLQSLGHKII